MYAKTAITSCNSITLSNNTNKNKIFFSLFKYKIHCISVYTELVLYEKERKKMRLLCVIW